MSKELTIALKKNFTDHKFLLSFISPSGYENFNDNLFDCVIYLPLETSKNLKQFYSLISPKITLFTKNELWPNYIEYAKLNGSKVYSVGGNFKYSYFKKLIGLNSAIKKIDMIFVTNENSKKTIEKIGNKNVIICGDLRYDSLIPDLNHAENRIISNFINDKKCIVFGSTWKEDERLIVRYINESEKDLKYIIAPHEITANSFRLKKQLGEKAVLYSEISSISNYSNFKCLIIDNIGMLSSLYKFSNVSYVGGGVGNSGLHNTIEPAYFSKPIIIGKNYKKFDEANTMVKNGGMISISNYNEFYRSLEGIIMNKEIQDKMSENNNQHFINNKGAIKIILKYLLK
tara:strand:- start:753 stop:1784 length:1032 start_codon:yes stop_codon:yes gene_type:complete